MCTHTEGHTRLSALARRGRFAGVLRPWHAGREPCKNVGGPDVPGSGTSPRVGDSAVGPQGETRPQNDAGTVPLRRNARQAGGAVLATGTPAVGVGGVVSSSVRSGRASRPHGAGLDGSPPPGQAPHPGHVGPELDAPTSLRALASRGSLETVTVCTEASAPEEPDAGKLHVRVCTGDVG